jgi:uncharacterized membrane protein
MAYEFRFGTGLLHRGDSAHAALSKWGYSLLMSRRAYAAAFVALGLVATYAFQPGLGHFMWSAIVWGILMMSTLMVLAVLANILMVLVHMWTGYTPKQEQRLEQDAVDLGKEMLRFEPTSQDEPKRVA